jgi:uncharacterized protein (DUF1800 family)
VEALIVVASKSSRNQFLVKHLLRRAGFGCTPTELAYYQKLGYEKCVKVLLDPEKVDDSGLDALIANQDFDYTRIDDLKRWWIYRMAFTKRPLEEKMTLFWHGHFATSVRKVELPYRMYMQNKLMRTMSLGNFHDLLLSMTKDPAMIVWLDNQQNKKGQPNENYAREVMELFSLGIGHYTERDIKESGRAFTGWQTHQDGFFFNASQHDYGEKTFLGQTGNFNGDDIIGIIVQQPAVGKFLAQKLCMFFAADEPTPAIITDVAKAYRPGGDNIKEMLRTLFMHDDFQNSYLKKIKSPVEFVIGSLKSLEVTQLDSDVATQVGRMGQSLFDPANVKGWDGGTAWIATDTMMERFNFTSRLTQQKFDAIEGYMKPSMLIQNQGLTTPNSMIDYFLTLLVDHNVPDSTPSDLLQYFCTDSAGKSINPLQNDKVLDSKLRGMVHLIMTLPTYQFC